MPTSSLDDRDIQQLLVALRYWRAHRSTGHTRRTDPPFTADVVDRLVAKLTASLSVEMREPRPRRLGTDPPSAADRPSTASDQRPKSSSRR